MENSTKIYIGVGAAALIGFLLLRNKAAAQKTTTTGGTTGGKVVVDHPAGTGSVTPEPPCPAGSSRVELECIVAPCPPSMCLPNDFGIKKPPVGGVDHPAPPAGCKYDANWNLVCDEVPPPPVFVDDVVPAPMPAPSYSYEKFPMNEYYRDNMYYQNLFNNGGGIGKVTNEEVSF